MNPEDPDVYFDYKVIKVDVDVTVYSSLSQLNTTYPF